MAIIVCTGPISNGCSQVIVKNNDLGDPVTGRNIWWNIYWDKKKIVPKSKHVLSFVLPVPAGVLFLQKFKCCRSRSVSLTWIMHCCWSCQWRSQGGLWGSSGRGTTDPGPPSMTVTHENLVTFCGRRRKKTQFLLIYCCLLCLVLFFRLFLFKSVIFLRACRV